MAAQRAERGLQIDLDPAQLTGELEQAYQRDAEPDGQLHRDLTITGSSPAGVGEVCVGIVRVVHVIERVGGHVDAVPRDLVWRGFEGVQRYAYGAEVTFEKRRVVLMPWNPWLDGVCIHFPVFAGRGGYDELVHAHEHFEGFVSKLFVDAEELALCFCLFSAVRVAHVQVKQMWELVGPLDEDYSRDHAQLVDRITNFSGQAEEIEGSCVWRA